MYWNNSRYYGIVDTSCGPQQTFLLFYSRYNGHLGRILHSTHESEWLFNLSGDIFTSCYLSAHRVSGRTLSLKIPFVIISVDKYDKQKNIKYSDLFPLYLHYFRGILVCFAILMFLTDLRFRVASAVLDIPSCLARKDCPAISLPIISSSSLVKYLCSPYNL